MGKKQLGRRTHLFQTLVDRPVINLVKDELYDRFINDAVAEYKEKFNKQLKIYNVVISDGAHKVC